MQLCQVSHPCNAYRWSFFNGNLFWLDDDSSLCAWKQTKTCFHRFHYFVISPIIKRNMNVKWELRLLLKQWRTETCIQEDELKLHKIFFAINSFSQHLHLQHDSVQIAINYFELLSNKQKHILKIIFSSFQTTLEDFSQSWSAEIRNLFDDLQNSQISNLQLNMCSAIREQFHMFSIKFGGKFLQLMKLLSQQNFSSFSPLFTLIKESVIQILLTKLSH
jgi:hypothetical protein